jgi:D-alanyl-lipoteichoic acid acyltransferase DltB (MBOAT superfamily)
VSGFWHGANWTFIVWGALNAIYFLPLLLSNKNRHNLEIVAMGKLLPSLKDAFNILLTFSLTCLAWVFFRAASISDALHYLSGIFSKSLFTIPEVKPFGTITLIIIFLVIEWIGRANNYALEAIGHSWQRPLRYAFYYLLIIAIFLFSGKEQQFIYFQF